MFEGRTGFLTGNLVLDLSILAWFLAQLIKTVANLVVNRNLDLKRMVGSGDMPSSHSSFICAATASIGQIYGWQAPLFSLAAVVALVVRDYHTAIEMMAIWGVVALFRRVMEPKFVGDQTGLSPVLSLLSVYVGMKLGGVLGMILGPVLTLVLLNLASMGLFRGLRADLSAAAWDVAAILSHRPEDA